MTGPGELVPLDGGWVFDSVTSHPTDAHGPHGAHTLYHAKTRTRTDQPTGPSMLGAWAWTPDKAVEALQRFVAGHVRGDYAGTLPVAVAGGYTAEQGPGLPPGTYYGKERS